MDYQAEHGDKRSATPPQTGGLRRWLALALTCAAVVLPASAGAQELGRLFLTPEQRADLERRRATNRAEEEAPQIKEGPLMLNGHVQRSSGKSATWINGQPQYDELGGRDPSQVSLEPNPGDPRVTLKVGQTLERTSGTIRDGLEGGELKVRRPNVPANAR